MKNGCFHRFMFNSMMSYFLRQHDGGGIVLPAAKTTGLLCCSMKKSQVYGSQVIVKQEKI